METLVLDASIAIKWVIQEDGSDNAVALRGRYRFSAPDLLIPECANILWKKARRHEISGNEAMLAGQLLQQADIELTRSTSLMSIALELALDLDHPAYDCLYLALALQSGSKLLTADDRLLRIIHAKAGQPLAELCVHYKSELLSALG
jgi:predicted nucleic acid-binding protein